MKNNVAWSVLASGVPVGPYGRLVDPNAVNWLTGTAREMVNVLVPYNDNLLRSLYVEELVQLTLRSSLRSRLLDLDPVQSYTKAPLLFPEPGAQYKEIADSLTFFTSADEDALRRRGQGEIYTMFSIDMGTSRFTSDFGSETFVMASGLSSPIILVPGLILQFRETTALPAHSGEYRYILRSSVDWPALLSRLQMSKPVWSSQDLRQIWEQDVLWTDRIAAYVMSTVELMKRGD